MKHLFISFIYISIYFSANSQITVEFDTYHPNDNVNQIVTYQEAFLENNTDYLITVNGTFSLWAPGYWSNPCGLYEDSPITPSTSGPQTGKVSHDFGFNFGLPSNYWCNLYSNFPSPVEPFTISLDGGTTWFNPTLNQGYNTDHTYTFDITGLGHPLKVKAYDINSSDNYGKLSFQIENTNPITCSIPAGISHSLAPPARCNITWNHISGVQKYDVHYKKKDDSSLEWTRVTSYNNIRSLHYLEPNTVYQYFVRPYCNGTWDFSYKSVLKEFNTANIPSSKLINPISNKEFKLYPNPASKFIHITKLDTEAKQGFIYDSQGKKVKTFNISHESELRLNIDDLNFGMYFIKIGNQHQKLIINNPIFS